MQIHQSAQTIEKTLSWRTKILLRTVKVLKSLQIFSWNWQRIKKNLIKTSVHGENSGVPQSSILFHYFLTVYLWFFLLLVDDIKIANYAEATTPNFTGEIQLLLWTYP